MAATLSPEAKPALADDGDVKTVLDGLSHSSVLRALPPEDIEALLPHVYRMTVRPGERLYAKGDPGDALYVVDQGSVSVQNGPAGGGSAGPSAVLGEAALLHGEARDETATAETEVTLWRVSRADYERVVHASTGLKAAHERAVTKHRAGEKLAHEDIAHKRAWVGIALRARSAKHRGLKTWHIITIVGFALWALLKLNDSAGWIQSELIIAAIQLIAGLLLIDGASEALILATDRTGARFNWDGFTSGTIGSLVETFPEFVVITFLVFVQPMAAFVTAAVTLFNNGLAFSIYSFFLPKDQKGRFVMPESLSKAGNEVLIAGSGIALLVGLVMIGSRAEGVKTAFSGLDLIVLAIVFIAIYAYYQYASIRYYSEGYGADNPNQAPDPARLGHDTSWGAIGLAALIGLGASYFGGDAIGSFADTALNQLHWPTIPTAAGLAFFAGFSEFVVVFQAHRRGEIGIALSNTFGGITQVQTLLLALAMGVIGIAALTTGSAVYSVPINIQTIMLMVLQFPMLYVLTNFIEDDHTLNNLDAAAMTGVYLLLLYFLFSF